MSNKALKKIGSFNIVDEVDKWLHKYREDFLGRKVAPIEELRALALKAFNTRTPQSPEAKMGRHDIVMFTGELVYRMMNPDTKMNVPTIVYEQVEIELDRHLAVCESDKEEDKNG